MGAVTICSDFEVQEEKSVTASTSPVPSLPFLLPPTGTNNQIFTEHLLSDCHLDGWVH